MEFFYGFSQYESVEKHLYECFYSLESISEMTMFLYDVVLNVAYFGVVSNVSDQYIRFGMVNRVIDHLVISRLADLLAKFLTLLVSEQEFKFVGEHRIDHDVIPFIFAHESQLQPCCLESP